MQILSLLIITLCIAGCGLWLFRYLKIMDKPGRDIAARKPVPTMQGIFLYGALILSLLVVFPALLSNHQVWPLVVGSGLIMLLFAIDEGRSLKVTNQRQLDHLVDVIPSWIKLFMQLLIIVGTIVFAGFYQREFVFLGVSYLVPVIVGLFLALIWFLLFINAINRFDYAYGQASGLSFLGFITIVILVSSIVLPHYTGISPQHYETLQIVVSLATVFAVITLVYTIVEYKPSGLVRDAGVMVYGFALAYLSLLGGAKIGTMMVALSLPLFDAIRVICHRIFVLRKNPLKGDYTHLHHRLLALGRNKIELRRFVWIWSIVMMILILLQGTNRLNKIVIFGLFALIYFGVNAYLFRYKKLPMTLITEKKG